MYLFGSFVRGDWLVDSDIDLVVVSPGLRDVPWHERYPLLRRMMPPDIPTDILAYTPEEFEEVRRRSVIIMDAESYWVELTEEALT
ncbi:MAG: DNA polymerase III subunit beta [Vulcanisaeta sp. OSP_8]|nr:MAG: DNA polymerase III subunit beta [Vulcanisaeta sp. OSP_8]